MHIEDFWYGLPKDLIAQFPKEPRDSSRLFVLDRNNGGHVSHCVFKDILNIITPNDLLVMNNSRVIPVRLFGKKTASGGKVECLLLCPLSDKHWEVLVKPGKRLPPGSKIIFNDGMLEGEILEKLPGGSSKIKFTYNGDFQNIVKKIGATPLPPYINASLLPQNKIAQWYQTVYAMNSSPFVNHLPSYSCQPFNNCLTVNNSFLGGSVAAPTAGLHFTEDLLNKLKTKGVLYSFVTLHVGWGTFKPVKVSNIYDHKMHEEWFVLSQETADMINHTKNKGGRIFAVGTTTCRVLEECTKLDGNDKLRENERENDKKVQFKAASGWTNLFIYPGYKFKCVDALITNFHLPGTSLLLLVAAFAGTETILEAYDEAVKEGYRFYSFGDAMLIL